MDYFSLPKKCVSVLVNGKPRRATLIGVGAKTWLVRYKDGSTEKVAHNRVTSRRPNRGGK